MAATNGLAKRIGSPGGHRGAVWGLSGALTAHLLRGRAGTRPLRGLRPSDRAVDLHDRHRPCERPGRGRGVSGLTKRVHTLEVALRPAPVDPERGRQEQERLERERAARAARVRELLATMAPEHVALLVAVRGVGADGRPCEPLDDPGAVHLAEIADEMIDVAGASWWPAVNQRLALPPPVADAYLRHGPAAWRDGTCNACRLPLPWRLHGHGEGWGRATGPHVFAACPDCGSTDIAHGYGRR